MPDASRDRDLGGAQSRVLVGKIVLLISPQPWDHIPVSKHHYALELARRGNRVFYLHRHETGRTGTATASKLLDQPRVTIVRYRPRLPSVLRHHVPWLYRLMTRGQPHRVLDALPERPDVVWCFDPDLFPDLAAFGAPLTIFHPVDRLIRSDQVAVARSADVVLSVSREILAAFDGLPVPTRFINHGLAPPFVSLARAGLRGATPARPAGPLRVGYAGNLLRPVLDRRAILEMVAEHADVEFHFWGPRAATSARQRSLPSSILDFPAVLEGCRNVRLHGVVSSALLAPALQRMDCLLLAYGRDRHYDRSNAHKILEYLSAGRVIVSSRIEMYADQPDLIRMPDRDDGSLQTLLSDTLSRLAKFNDIALQDRRRRMALRHTYARQLDRIDAILARLPGRGLPAGPRPSTLRAADTRNRELQ